VTRYRAAWTRRGRIEAPKEALGALKGAVGGGAPHKDRTGVEDVREQPQLINIPCPQPLAHLAQLLQPQVGELAHRAVSWTITAPT